MSDTRDRWAATLVAVGVLAVTGAGLRTGYQVGLLDGARIAQLAAPMPAWPDDYHELVEMGRKAQAGREEAWTEAELEWFVLRLLLAAHDHGVPPRLAMSVAITESGLDWHAQSPRGAVGVMQVLPETAAALGFNAYNRAENIEAGVAYLGQMLRRYDGNVALAVAAYNAGPRRVDQAGRRVPAIRETKRYVRRVMARWEGDLR